MLVVFPNLKNESLIESQTWIQRVSICIMFLIVAAKPFPVQFAFKTLFRLISHFQ